MKRGARLRRAEKAAGSPRAAPSRRGSVHKGSGRPKKSTPAVFLGSDRSGSVCEEKAFDLRGSCPSRVSAGRLEGPDRQHTWRRIVLCFPPAFGPQRRKASGWRARPYRGCALNVTTCSHGRKPQYSRCLSLVRVIDHGQRSLRTRRTSHRTGYLGNEVVKRGGWEVLCVRSPSGLRNPRSCALSGAGASRRARGSRLWRLAASRCQARTPLVPFLNQIAAILETCLDRHTSAAPMRVS